MNVRALPGAAGFGRTLHGLALVGLLAVVAAASELPRSPVLGGSPAEVRRLEVAGGTVPWRSDTARQQSWHGTGGTTGGEDGGVAALAPLLTSAATLALSLLVGYAVLRRRQHEPVSLAARPCAAASSPSTAGEERTAAFLAILAHELRDPLAPIRSAVELMRHVDRDPEPRLVRARDIIDRQVTHLGRLLDDLSDAARLSHNLILLRVADVAVTDIVRDALELSADAVARGAHGLVVRHADPGLRVRGDRVRLVQVVAALLDNAARFTPSGGHLRVRTERDGGVVQITVQDDGVGIAAAAQAHIFELFAHGDAAPAHGGRGLGVGLALVRQLVALHGGSVELDSAPGRGSTFRVRLPAR